MDLHSTLSWSHL